MKFTASADALHTAISRASAVTPQRGAALVAYTGVLLEIKDNQLQVTGSDGEVTVTMTVEVSDSTAGSALVVPKRLTRWLGALEKSSQVCFETVGTSEVKAIPEGGQEYRFRTLVASFPASPPPSKNSTPVDLSGLKEAVSAVKDAADEVLGGTGAQAVQLVGRDSSLLLHATDRLRLSRAVLPAAGVPDFTALVEVKALEMAERLGSTSMFSDPRGKVLDFYGPDHRITVRTLEAEFPPVDVILEAAPAYSVKVRRQQLRSCLERLACVSDDTAPLVLEIDGREVTLKAESASVGGGQETIEALSPAPSMVELGVNLGYLLSAVSSASTDTLEIGWSSPVMPLFISSAGHPQVTAVVMPIRLAD